MLSELMATCMNAQDAQVGYSKAQQILRVAFFFFSWVLVWTCKKQSAVTVWHDEQGNEPCKHRDSYGQLQTYRVLDAHRQHRNGSISSKWLLKQKLGLEIPDLTAYPHFIWGGRLKLTLFVNQCQIQQFACNTATNKHDSVSSDTLQYCAWL